MTLSAALWFLGPGVIDTQFADISGGPHTCKSNERIDPARLLGEPSAHGHTSTPVKAPPTQIKTTTPTLTNTRTKTRTPAVVNPPKLSTPPQQPMLFEKYNTALNSRNGTIKIAGRACENIRL